MDLAHPLVGSVLLPLLLSLILTGAWLFVARNERARCPAAIAIGLAVIIAQLGVFGPLTWPAKSGPDKLPWLLATLLLGGLVMDRFRPGRPVALAATVAAVAAMSLWFAWPQLGRGDTGLPILLALASALGLVCIGGLAAATAEGAARATVVIMAGLAFGRRGLPGRLAVAAVFVAGPPSRRLPVSGRWSRSTLEPLYVIAIGVLPLVVAILLATPPVAPDDPYYR